MAELPFSCFGRYKSSPDGYRYCCKECRKKESKDYREKYPERVKEQKAVHYLRNKDYYVSYRERTLEQRAETWQRWYEKNKAHCRKREANYRNKNRLHIRAKNMLRHARKKTTMVEPVSYKKILERDGYVCHICTGQVDTSDIHFDHVVPLARGGTHTYDNIKVSHSLCNMRKGAKLWVR